MPILRDWMLHHPNVWTAQQVADYLFDTRKALLAGIGPTALTVGVPAACGILLQVCVDLVAADPRGMEQVLEYMESAAERVAGAQREGSATQ